MVSTSYLKNFCSNDDVDDDGVIIFLWRIEEYVGVEISWHRFKFFYPSHLKLFASPPFRLKLVFSHFSTQSLVTQLWTLQHPTLRCWFGRVFSDVVHLSQRHQRR